MLFHALLENATRICAARFGTLSLYGSFGTSRFTMCRLPMLTGKLSRRQRAPYSKNSKANRIETMKGPAESEKFVRWKSKKNSEENG
jgi:hypothetical protein